MEPVSLSPILVDEPVDARAPERRAPVVEVLGLSRRFGGRPALLDVDLAVEAGEVHALLGPNGAGKTTLLRVLIGLVEPMGGSVRVLGEEPARLSRSLRSGVGLVPSGDRTFYLRISGLENLVFFAKMYGLRRREAIARARDMLQRVGLEDAASRPVGIYSHGMHKRLSVARALLPDPSVLLVDEATHDLDPEGAQRVRDLVAAAASRRVAVIWTTQRIEEIRGFADSVTVLREGAVRFAGSVPQLVLHAELRRYLVRLRLPSGSGRGVEETARRAVAALGNLTSASESDADHFVLALRDGAILGDAISALSAEGVQVLSCGDERPEIEQAFLALTKGER